MTPADLDALERLEREATAEQDAENASDHEYTTIARLAFRYALVRDFPALLRSARRVAELRMLLSRAAGHIDGVERSFGDEYEGRLGELYECRDAIEAALKEEP